MTLADLAAGFSIAGHDFRWGIKVSELRTALAGESQLAVYEAAAQSCKCSPAYSFPSISCYARGPLEDRPVLTVTFDLAAYSSDYTETRPAHWSDEIEKLLGKPEKIFADKPTLGRAPNSGSVVYSARWRVGEVSFTLSLFGGFRSQEAGISVAGLYLQWLDQTAAALPYLKGNIEKEKLLSAIAEGEASLQLFEIDLAQEPFQIVNFGPASERQNANGEEWRRSQRALWKENLFETPSRWRSTIGARQIALWHSRDGIHWGLSNQWDTTVFEVSHRAVPVTWVNLLPARGAGGTTLTVGDLAIKDNHTSAKVENIVRAIEPIIGKSIQAQEFADY